MGKIAKQIGVLNLEKVQNRLLKRGLISLKFVEWRFILRKIRIHVKRRLFVSMINLSF